MNQLMSKLMQRTTTKISFAIGLLYFVILPEVTFATSTGQVQKKLDSALVAIQAVLTGVAVGVGIASMAKIYIKCMPGLEDPNVKNEMWKSIGNVALAVGGVAAGVWILPWVYNILT